MKLLENIGSFLVLFVLPAITGALSGYVGIHLLFSFVKAIARWRGQRVAIVCTALLCGVPLFVLIISPLLLESFLNGVLIGLIGALVGGAFASGTFKKSKLKIAFAGSLLGLFIGSFVNIFIGLLAFRPVAGAENYLLIVPFFIFIVIGGFMGLFGGGVYAFRKLQEKTSN